MEVNGRLRLASGDYGQQSGLPAPIDTCAKAETFLLERRVTASRRPEGTADLLLEFEGQIQLYVIADTSAYEPWFLNAPGAHCSAIFGDLD